MYCSWGIRQCFTECVCACNKIDQIWDKFEIRIELKPKYLKDKTNLGQSLSTLNNMNVQTLEWCLIESNIFQILGKIKPIKWHSGPVKNWLALVLTSDVMD
jgi:hypothetical protein